MSSKNKHRVLFHRKLISPTSGINGGNLKVRDCYNHVLSSEHFYPEIYFSPDTVWNTHPGNHWTDLKDKGIQEWNIKNGDTLLLAGKDWEVLPPEVRKSPPVPVINIAHPRHIRPNDHRKEFLAHPAIRIAKSNTGANILKNYGVNGPVFVIPDGIDLSQLPPIPPKKDIDILIIGRKEPEFAKKIGNKLKRKQFFSSKKKNIYIQLPPPLPTRLDFLNLLARSKVAVCLPLQEQRGMEGFYLPALEAMALETLVVCPHAIGNVDHCIHEYNCIVPPYNYSGILAGLAKILDLSDSEKNKLIQNGLATAEKHDIENERKAFIDLLEKAPAIWAQKELFSQE